MSELTQICKKYENYTDKGPTGPYYIKHNYTEIYGDLLRYYKNRKNNILEIGIRQGGSLKMWQEYFKKSTISSIRDAKIIIDNFKGRINKCSIIDRTHCIPSLDDINVIYYK